MLSSYETDFTSPKSKGNTFFIIREILEHDKVKLLLTSIYFTYINMQPQKSKSTSPEFMHASTYKCIPKYMPVLILLKK